ncbi:hypothetical protein [Pseudomonas sp. IT-P291]|uniref:hypothetical protein n=1 Tax=Pseudomonas sp. IT-P291 TaxID=3026448 RepID=UPI0039E0152D
MKTRESIRKYIVQHGAKASRFRTWLQAAESESKGLLREQLPSGYSSWFAIVEGKSIWWAYSDSSDGGVWTSEGVAITGYRVSYEEGLDRAIYDVCYPRALNLT